MSEQKWTAADMPDQSGRRAIVTGANSGLGLVTARELAAHGASVTLAVRDTGKGERRGRRSARRRPPREVRVRRARPGRPRLGARVRRGALDDIGSTCW